MKQGLAVALHLAAVVVAALIHVRWHPEPHHGKQLEPESDTVDPTPRAYVLERDEGRPHPCALAGVPAPHAWADWLYTTRLLALGRPPYDWRVEDDPDPEGWSHRRWHELAVRAEQSGDMDLALTIWERYRPRRTCGLDPEPEWAAKAYADLCYRMGRRACFLTLYVRLMGEVAMFDDEAGVDFTLMARLPALGVERHRFLRGLVYQFHSPRDVRTERPEVEPQRLASAIERARLTDVMLPWLRQEASNSDLDEHNRFRAERTLHYLREQAGSLLLLPPSVRDERGDVR